MGIVLCFFIVEKLCLLREEYLMQSIIIEKDRDFLAKCKTPEGYASMNHHPNFCEKILATAHTGAFWHAVRKVASSLPSDQLAQGAERIGWKLALAAGVAFIVMPSVFINHNRARQYHIPQYSKKDHLI